VVSLFTVAILLSSPVAAEPGQFVVRPVAEKKLNGLPPGPFYWRIENFRDTRPGAERCGRQLEEDYTRRVVD
jgi:hypothetical protein